MSEYILVQIAKEHLPYEVDMLRGIFESFKQSQSRPGLRPQAPPGRAYTNRLNSGHGLHSYKPIEGPSLGLPQDARSLLLRRVFLFHPGERKVR